MDAAENPFVGKRGEHASAHLGTMVDDPLEPVGKDERASGAR